MREALLPYYERELTFIRQMAAEFAQEYPSVAGRLQLEPNRCQDPHVERLIEAFALLCGRIHHKLDDEYPEITEGLLEALYPHYLRPIPSQAIAQFQVDGSQSLPTAVQVPRGTMLHSRPRNGQICSFRTCYPVTLWPMRVTGASLSMVNRFAAPGVSTRAAALLRIQIECLNGLRLSNLPIGSLRFYLNGESAAVHALYEAIFLHSQQIILLETQSKNKAQAVLPASSLQQVGFAESEGILPYDNRSFPGYRLLQEYFSFPEKFFFFDITGLDKVSGSSFGSAFEILIPLNEPDDKHKLPALEQSVDSATFQFGCTPIVNLFDRIAEPIRVTQTKTEYRIIPDQHRQLNTEVYSVNRVTSTVPYLQESRRYEPFYSIRHETAEDSQTRFWHAHRRPSFRKSDSGSEVYLSLVDRNFNPAVPPDEVLSVEVTCTNRAQASGLRLDGEFGELEPEGAALLRVRCLRKPTESQRPPLRRGLQWRLISHLSLNHLSIVEQGRQALQEILRLYDFTNQAAVRKQVAGIVDVTSRPCLSRMNSDIGVVFCRGTEVTIEFDEEQYVGTGVFLLSSVLHRFMGLYSALNSFSRLTVRTRKGVLKQWPPLAGEQVLL
jgi:type VI secretion system protein ImpG